MRLSVLLAGLFVSAVTWAAAPEGYYREPALHGETLVFVAEDDLWKVAVHGGVARRLTTHPGREHTPAISPDGRTLAFTATYEGPREVYTMPLEGGRPVRRTYGIRRAEVTGWTPDGRVLVATDRYSTLPDWQLIALDVSDPEAAGILRRVPLAQAADASYAADGATLLFTRHRFQGSHTKRYRGGTAQSVWRFREGQGEALPLTADYPGTSKRPMVWKDRVWFASDRDGTMNLWSMDLDGADLRQHTRHDGWDVKSPSHHAGRIVYQSGADIRLYDTESGIDRRIPIGLNTDLDQTRENWVDDPMRYLSSVRPSADGERVVLTSRGRVFVVPRGKGRRVEVTTTEGVRYRRARFMPDGEKLLALSDASGEVELWMLPANGVGEEEQLTRDGRVLRWEGLASPDGKLIAHHDKDFRLFVYDVAKKTDRQIDSNRIGRFAGLSWSPDSRWLAYVARADNQFRRILLYSVADDEITAVTTDRYYSFSPAWSPDGRWLYFLSDRNLRSVVGAPWGAYQPEPYLDRTTRIYHLPLVAGLRSPFAPADELQGEEDPPTEPERKGKKEKKGGKEKNTGKDDPPKVSVELEGISARLMPVPIPSGNYDDLTVNGDALFWESRPGRSGTKLMAAAIDRDEVEPRVLVSGIRGYELSANGRRILLRKGDGIYLLDAATEPVKDLDKARVDLSGWKFSVDPRREWRQMFHDAWRLERDYFYDPDMHGVAWPAIRQKYVGLLDRVTSRDELSDLIAQMVSELSALHTYVRGGDKRDGEDDVDPSTLGAVLERDEDAGGYRVHHVYRSDPDEPDRAAPLARPGVDVGVGAVIEMVNGTSTLDVADIGVLLRGQKRRQVLLRVKPADGAESRDVIVRPISLSKEADLRYHEWEYTRRLEVEQRGGGDVGYVHLRAMGGSNYTEWATHFYPVYNRQGLIIDVRHNRGGNIDSWILGRLLRKAWFHWSQRVGQAPSWNMQYAFRGHVVVLCNERTASDGEAFAEGIRRLDIGTIIGTRTWGGEIWLSSSNTLVDRGIATAAEFGVFSPEGEWLIEGHGVEPDIVVDNLPHETFNGRDAQLEAALEFLERRIRESPVTLPPIPEEPDKSR